MEHFISKKSAHKIVYCVSNVICKDGQSIASKPLTVRKTVLNSLELNHPNVFIIEGIQGNGLTYFALAKEKNLEGIVLKKANFSYEINKHSHN